MKDLAIQARAVEARLRELEYEMQEEAADTITALCTALEAAQPTLTIDGMTPSQFAMRELYEFQEVTGCDTAAQAKEKLEAAQKDTERLDYLETQCEAYGFEDEHLGNRWVLDGPFHSARKCIDAAIQSLKEKKHD